MYMILETSRLVPRGFSQKTSWNFKFSVMFLLSINLFLYISTENPLREIKTDTNMKTVDKVRVYSVKSMWAAAQIKMRTRLRVHTHFLLQYNLTIWDIFLRRKIQEIIFKIYEVFLGWSLVNHQYEMTERIKIMG